MSKEDNGGPAFPHTTEVGEHGEYDLSNYPGMSLRDYFAAKAMQAIISASGCGGEVDYKEWSVAYSSYAMADEMLKERKR